MTMEEWERCFEWLLTWGHAPDPPLSPDLHNLRTTQHGTLRTLHAHATMGTRAAPLRSPRASVHAAHSLARVPRCALRLVPMSFHGVPFALTASADERARWNSMLLIHMLYNWRVIVVVPQLSNEAYPPCDTSSIVVGLTAAMNNLHMAGRSAETCGDPDDTLAWFRLNWACQFVYTYSTDPAWISTVILVDKYVLQTIMGMVFLTQEDSTVPCYFLTSGILADNFFTTNATERDAATIFLRSIR
ncbi:hypothetical protein C8R45DRAFT_1108930 [Mycena sanguinolenta]|nr:hypothetical protein C8R45DRAFT_1108930 [Mycena sanguinolenta]